MSPRPSAQSQIVVALLCVIYLVRMPRLTFWVYVSALSAFLAVAPYFALELHRMDPNTGIRSSLWRDTITAVEQTFGVGVGYGTEYITNNFIELKGRSWTVISESAAGRLFIGTHSGIYDVLLRLGVVGLLLFAIWLLQELAVAGRSRNLATAQTTAGIGIVLMTAIFVNVGMASMGFVFGVSFCVAALRHFARDGEYLGPRR